MSTQEEVSLTSLIEYKFPSYFTANETITSSKLNSIILSYNNFLQQILRHNHVGAYEEIYEHGSDSISDSNGPTRCLKLLGYMSLLNKSIRYEQIDDNAIHNNNILNNTIKSEKIDTTTIGNGLERITDNNIQKLQAKVDNNSITCNANGQLQVKTFTDGNPVGTIIAMYGKNLYSLYDTTVFKLKTGNYLLCNGGQILNTPSHPRPEFANLIYLLTGDKNATQAFLPVLGDARYLQGADNVNCDSSDIIAAGLPNHFHGVGVNRDNNAGEFLASRANSYNPTAVTVTTINNGGVKGWNGSGNDAGHWNNSVNHTDYAANMVTSLVRQEANTSTGGGVYNNSTTVTPKSLKVVYFIKY